MPLACDLLGGRSERFADGEDRGGGAGGGARGGEDRALQPFFAEWPERKLREGVGQECREERDRSPGGDERGEDEAVVAAVADVRLKSAEAVADIADHGVKSRSAVPSGPDRVFAAGERHRAMCGQRGVIGVQGREDVFAQEVLAVDIAVAGDRDRLVFDAHDEIDLAGAQFGNRRGGFTLDDLDAKIGSTPGQAFEGAGQEGEGWGLHEGHAQAASGRIRCLREVCSDRLVGVERLFCVGSQPAAGGRELDVPSGAAQQPGPGLAFELGELYRDRRGAVGQRLRDGCDGPSTSQLLEQSQPPQFHHSDNATCSRLKYSLVTTNARGDPGGVLIVSLLLAPVVMFVAVCAEQRRGATTGGWVAALPVALPISAVTVALDSGSRVADRLVWSAAGHVAAQVLFAVAFAAVLRRRGCVRGFLAGTAVYGALSVILLALPASMAAAIAIPVLIVAPRMVPRHGARGGSSRSATATVLGCLGASVVVAAGVFGSRIAGPSVGGALVAFPTVSSLLALLIAGRAGNNAGADALAGLVRSLPCYLAFCLCAAITIPAAGTPAIPPALLAALAIGRLTWRSIAGPLPAPSTT